MGGRGSSNKGAAKAPHLLLPGGTRYSLEDLAKLLGFDNKEQLLHAQELRKLIGDGKNKSDGAKVAKYLTEHGGGFGSIGPIMLRIGLPRDKLLDIFHALKPLHDHGILMATMPLSYKHYEDPFDLAASTSPSDTEAMNVLMHTRFSIPNGATYLNRLRDLPIDIIVSGNENRKHK